MYSVLHVRRSGVPVFLLGAFTILSVVPDAELRRATERTNTAWPRCKAEIRGAAWIAGAASDYYMAFGLA